MYIGGVTTTTNLRVAASSQSTNLQLASRKEYSTEYQTHLVPSFLKMKPSRLPLAKYLQRFLLPTPLSILRHESDELVDAESHEDLAHEYFDVGAV